MKALKLKTLSMAIAATLITPVAMADTTVYGQAHLSFASLDDNNGSATAVASHASRFGVKGSMGEEGQTNVVYKMEWDVDVTDGATIKARSQYAGLKGVFGEVRIGHDDSPYKNAGKKSVEFFSDTYADYNNVIDKGQDTRTKSSVSYTVKAGPGKLSMMYGAGADTTAVADQNTGDSTAIAYSMQAGAVSFAIATQSINDTGTAGVDGTETGTKVAVGLEMNKATKIGFMYETVSNDSDTVDDKNTVISVKHKMSGGAIKFVYGMKDQGLAADATMTALGYDMKVNKSTKAYFLVANGADNGLKDASKLTGDATVAGVGLVVKF